VTALARPLSQPEPAPLPDADHAVAPAPRWHWLEVPRTTLEYGVTRFSGGLVDQWPHGDGHPVLVLPGFLAGEASTAYLRSFLARLGYTPYDWGLARNLGVRPHTEPRLAELVERITDEHGRSVSVIGWSAGGIFGREVGRRAPDRVRSVITLGSPFRGNHRATHAWRLWSLLNRNPAATALMTEAAIAARAEPLDIPPTCIYSRTDGIVAWQCCTSRPAPTTENVEVHCSHLGYGHNLETLYVIADRLAQPEGQWRPFRPA
jgi:pimeloyl-ACP methyl ester carboxylesterase